MDNFFFGMKKIGRELQRSDLHIIGLVSIFLSSKYEDVIPIHMS